MCSKGHKCNISMRFIIFMQKDSFVDVKQGSLDWEFTANNSFSECFYKIIRLPAPPQCLLVQGSSYTKTCLLVSNHLCVRNYKPFMSKKRYSLIYYRIFSYTFSFVCYPEEAWNLSDNILSILNEEILFCYSWYSNDSFFFVFPLDPLY